jgi:hypothetical protein
MRFNEKVTPTSIALRDPRAGFFSDTGGYVQVECLASNALCSFGTRRRLLITLSCLPPAFKDFPKSHSRS